MDRISPERRSANMSRIRGKDTGPELLVRRTLHRLGYRFRLHRKDLPGKPDVVLPKFRTVVLVHGCYWHRHPGCRLATMPGTNESFWENKFAKNVERDQRVVQALEALGWNVVVIWECETKDVDGLRRALVDRLPLRG